MDDAEGDTLEVKGSLIPLHLPYATWPTIRKNRLQRWDHIDRIKMCFRVTWYCRIKIDDKRVRAKMGYMLQVIWDRNWQKWETSLEATWSPS